MAPLPPLEGSKPNLSSNDSKVLQALFDAESSPSPASSTAQTDASLPPLPHISASELPSLQEREIKAIRPLQTSDNALPSIDTIKTAISDLTSIINEHPKYAPAFLNRAQAYRLLIDAEAKESPSSSSSSSTQSTTPAAHIFSDLAEAISLLTPRTPTAPVSPLQSRILANAHTHRAYILYKAARINSSNNNNNDNEQSSATDTDGVTRSSLLPPTLQDASADQLEEMASFDFQAGGRYGNPVAKQMAVHTNPYAKMCGAIVKDAMKAEIKEWADLK